MDNARDRLIVAALRCAANERGGLDGEDITEEAYNARQELDKAAFAYVQAARDADIGSQAPSGEKVAD